MRSIRNFILSLFFIFLSGYAYSQKAVDSVPPIKKESLVAPLSDSISPVVKKSSNKKKQLSPIFDSTKEALIIADTISKTKKDSTVTKKDSTVFSQPTRVSFGSIEDSILRKNIYINEQIPAIFFITEKKENTGKEFTFYLICIIVFMLGLFKTFYSNYFNNLFRVFFNTSIRQTQLTEQLLQAKLPSFLLNIFFAISTGVYIWLLFKYDHPPKLLKSHLLLPFCIGGIGILYFAKYLLVKFMGWMGGMQEASDNYIFIIFLVNKIAGIILVPFIVILAFTFSSWIHNIILFSLLVLGLLFLSRYAKIFGILRFKFPLQPLHFIIYVLAVEVIPILIIYKLVIDYII